MAQIAAPRRRPPSPHWYRVAGALMVAGVVAAAIWWGWAITAIHHAVENFSRVGAFGGTAHLDQTGPHTFWVEGDCLSCHQAVPDQYRSAADVLVVGPDGAALALRPLRGEWVFNTAGREGRALWLIDVANPGDHVIRMRLVPTDVENYTSPMPQRIAIGPGEGLPVRIVRPMVTLSLAGLAAGGVVMAITALRRRRWYAREAAIRARQRSPVPPDWYG